MERQALRLSPWCITLLHHSTGLRILCNSSTCSRTRFSTHWLQKVCPAQRLVPGAQSVDRRREAEERDLFNVQLPTKGKGVKMSHPYSSAKGPPHRLKPKPYQCRPYLLPEEPVEVVVVPIAVVVAVPRVTILIPHEHHRGAL